MRRNEPTSETRGDPVSQDRLRAIEAAFKGAWTGQGSTPFIVDIHPSTALIEDAARAARQVRLRTLLANYPTLGVWAVLHPLARNYGASSAEVYRHIGAFVGEDFSVGPDRDDLKRQYRASARAIGLPVSGNLPTDLFFAPLGPPAARHPELAAAFIDMALRRGPPAIEDTTAARNWQRTAVEWKCSGQARLIETVKFDSSAHCARRFEAWRHGQPPIGDMEAALFSAYDRAVESYGRTRESLVGPPSVVWHNDRLGIETEISKVPQNLVTGSFPQRLPGGKRQRIPPPWPAKLSWRAGRTSRDVVFAPADGEFLVFDADSGRCLSRGSISDGSTKIAASRIVVLASEPFQTSEFGASFPAEDSRYHLGWLEMGEAISFSSGATHRMDTPVETAAWIEGDVLGRDASRVLYACGGQLNLKLDPGIGGPQRILRARVGETVHYRNIDIPETGLISVPFAELKLNQAGSPAQVRFEVLAPGAAGDLDARSELSTTCWVWPGVAAPVGELDGLPIPENLGAARSAGLKLLDGLLSVDPRSSAETAILGIKDDGQTREFQLSARSEKLWHCRIASGDKIYVPRGEQLVFGHENRHDTIRLRSPDRDADLLVLGRRYHRPFRQRQQIEIGAELLETVEEDDRIALRRADGRVDILLRLRRATEPGDLELSHSGNVMALKMHLEDAIAGLVVRAHAFEHSPVEGGYSFNHLAPPAPPLPGIAVSLDHGTRQVEVTIDTLSLPSPGWIEFEVLREHEGQFPLRDKAGHPVRLGLSGSVARLGIRGLTELAGVLAAPEPEALAGQVRHALTPAYTELFSRLGAARMIGPVRSAIGVERLDGGIPRHDIVGVAPWVFEAASSALSGFSQPSGLSRLSLIGKAGAPRFLPSLQDASPLSDWLSALSSGADMPEGLGVDDLHYAIRLLRHRLRDTDLRELASRSEMRRNLTLLSGAYIETLDEMRRFDDAGGGDPLPARIAVQIERFARACALKRADPFIHDLAFRTGLDRAEVGWTFTILLRAGIEIFVYFRTLWDYATREGDIH